MVAFPDAVDVMGCVLGKGIAVRKDEPDQEGEANHLSVIIVFDLDAGCATNFYFSASFLQ